MGDRIREYRRVHGLSQKKLAKLLGIDQSTVGGWERAEHRPIRGNLEKMLRFLSYYPLFELSFKQISYSIFSHQKLNKFREAYQTHCHRRDILSPPPGQSAGNSRNAAGTSFHTRRQTGRNNRKAPARKH